MNFHHRHPRHREARPGPARYSGPPLRPASEMVERGIVKFYDPGKGFGFVERPGQPDVFLHASIVRKYGIPADNLQRDTKVRFSLAEQTVPGKRPEADAVALD